MPAIEVRDLTKRYGDKVAVDGLSLDVAEGEVFGLLGRNGAGKTTTVESIAGLCRPDAGTVRVLGLDPRADRAALRQVLGVQLQDDTLHHALTVTELVRLYRAFYRHGRDPRELIEMVGLGDQRGTRYQHLSGGQQQRLSVAIALAGAPRVVLLDELTTGLDPRARRTMWDMVRGLRAGGVTVLLVSHLMEEIERLCDRVALLEAGRIVAAGTPAELVAQAGLTVAGERLASLDEAFLALTGHPADEYDMREAR